MHTGRNKILRIALAILIFFVVLLPFGGFTKIIPYSAANTASIICSILFVILYLNGRRLNIDVKDYRGWFRLAMIVASLGILQFIIWFAA